jgi:hypothetical protein
MIFILLANTSERLSTHDNQSVGLYEYDITMAKARE